MIVVLGAGLIGLAVAFELATRGARVRVFDSGEAARGASWAGAGMLAPYAERLDDDPAFEALCLASLNGYPAFVERVRACGSVDAHLRLDGILDAAFDDAGDGRIRARVNRLRARGVDIRYVDRRDALALEPALAPSTLGASLCAAEGTVDNRRLGRALVAACRALGVRVDTGVRDLALEADARRVLGIRTADGFAAADVVVNALGAWASELRGVPDVARAAIVPVKGQMVALAAPRGFVRHVTWAPGVYVVPRDDGRVLLGATVERVGFDVRLTARGTRDLLAAGLAAMPALGDFTLAESWAGLRPATPDGLPYIGAAGLGGYMLACGHYRNGILLAPVTATAIADLIGGVDRADLAPFAPLRAKEAVMPPAKVAL